jgi:hypothetical protein
MIIDWFIFDHRRPGWSGVIIIQGILMDGISENILFVVSGRIGQCPRGGAISMRVSWEGL